MNFYLSDNHWGHANIIKFTNRPWADVDTMNREMTKRWNSVVSPKDRVYHLGDFSWSQPKHYMGVLNGTKILILGNHDKQKQCIGHFAEIHTRLEVEIDGKQVLLCHYPYQDARGPFSKDKFSDRHPVPDNWNRKWLLHGHTHNSTPRLNVEKKMINCCVEHWDYTPISEEQIIQIMREHDSIK